MVGTSCELSKPSWQCATKLAYQRCCWALHASGSRVSSEVVIGARMGSVMKRQRAMVAISRELEELV